MMILGKLRNHIFVIAFCISSIMFIKSSHMQAMHGEWPPEPLQKIAKTLVSYIDEKVDESWLKQGFPIWFDQKKAWRENDIAIEVSDVNIKMAREIAKEIDKEWIQFLGSQAYKDGIDIHLDKLDKQTSHLLSDMLNNYMPALLKGWLIGERFGHYMDCVCEEAPVYVRLLAFILLVQDVIERFPTSHHIVYTSFGSAGLLSDYVIIKTMVRHGYKNFTINLISSEYKEKKYEFLLGLLKKFDCEMRENLQFCIQQSLLAGNFLGKHLDEVSLNKINIFAQTSEYAQACQKNSSLQTTILTAIDPGKCVRSKIRGNLRNEEFNGAVILINQIIAAILILPACGKPRIYISKRPCEVVQKSLSLIGTDIQKLFLDYENDIGHSENYTKRAHLIEMIDSKLAELSIPNEIDLFSDQYLLIQDLASAHVRHEGIVLSVGNCHISLCPQASIDGKDFRSYRERFDKWDWVKDFCYKEIESQENQVQLGFVEVAQCE